MRRFTIYYWYCFGSMLINCQAWWSIPWLHCHCLLCVFMSYLVFGGVTFNAVLFSLIDIWLESRYAHWVSGRVYRCKVLQYWYSLKNGFRVLQWQRYQYCEESASGYSLIVSSRSINKTTHGIRCNQSWIKLSKADFSQDLWLDIR